MRLIFLSTLILAGVLILPWLLMLISHLWIKLDHCFKFSKVYSRLFHSPYWVSVIYQTWTPGNLAVQIITAVSGVLLLAMLLSGPVIYSDAKKAQIKRWDNAAHILNAVQNYDYYFESQDAYLTAVKESQIEYDYAIEHPWLAVIDPAVELQILAMWNMIPFPRLIDTREYILSYEAWSKINELTE